MKKVLSLLLVLSLASACLSGCRNNTPSTAEPSTAAVKTDREQNNEIAVGIASDLTGSLGPWKMSTADTREILFNVFEGLYKPDKSGDFVPAVAASYEVSADGLSYTFTLRDGVKFHNGAAVTPADVVYSYETCAAETVNTSVKSALAAMESVKADGNKIVIKLSAPNSDFLAYAASVYIAPADYAEQDTRPVGTGPFKYVSRRVQENIVFERFEEYWGSKAEAAKVTFRVYETETALMTALNSGTVDIVAHLTSAQIKGLSKDYAILEGTMNLVQALYLNNAVKPLDDIRVRQALCYAVDVNTMLQLTADGHGSRLGSSIYPSFGKYFDESLVNAYPYNAQKAKDLLKEAGYEKGFDLTITVPSNYTPHVDAAMVLAEQLKAVGINAAVQEVEWNSWLTDVYQGRNFQATVSGMDASTLTAGALLGRWVSNSGKNFCNFSDADYDAKVNEAGTITDDAKRTELYRQAEKILSDKAAHVYLQDLADFVAVRGSLEGYVFYPLYVMDLSAVKYK